MLNPSRPAYCSSGKGGWVGGRGVLCSFQALSKTNWMFLQNFSQTHIIFAPVAFFSTLNCINNYFFCCRYISPWCVYINMLAWGQLSFLDNCMHTSDPLREQSVELPVVQKVCESFLFTYCKDCWLIERVVSYVSPPHILVLGALLSPPSLPLFLSRSRSTGAGNGRGPQEPSRLFAPLFSS